MSDPFLLHLKAEEVLREKVQNPVPIRTEAEIQQLVHELEVQKIMLEMVNEELFAQNEEKEKRASELTLVNRQIVLQRERLEEITNSAPGAVFESMLRPDGST